MSLEQIIASRPQMDRAKIEATTEDDITRHMAEDGEDPDETPSRFDEVLPVAMVRTKLGLSQAAFARALRVPLATLRNWEQGRVRPDPAALSLLRIVAHDPKAALAALAR